MLFSYTLYILLRIESLFITILRFYHFKGMALGTRAGTFFIPFNFMVYMMGILAPYLPDYKNHNKDRK